MLKSQLAGGEKPKFRPSADSHFYDNRIDARRIVNDIKKNMLPFQVASGDSPAKAEQATTLAKTLIQKTNRFLDYRIAIVHHVGNPSMKFDQLDTLCNKAIRAYEDFLSAHKIFFETVQPYRFGEKELTYFYGIGNQI